MIKVITAKYNFDKRSDQSVQPSSIPVGPDLDKTRRSQEKKSRFYQFIEGIFRLARPTTLVSIETLELSREALGPLRLNLVP